MKKKKLNILKLIIANACILSVFVLLLLILPDKWNINFVIFFSYVSFATLFNLYITEGGE